MPNSFTRTRTQLLKYVCLFVVVAASHAAAQRVSISLGSGISSPGGTVAMDISLASSPGANPVAVQWTMSYSSSAVSGVNVVAQTSVTGEGKDTSCYSTPGSTTCVLLGLNQS